MVTEIVNKGMIIPASYEAILGRSSLTKSEGDGDIGDGNNKSYQQLVVDEMISETNAILTATSKQIRSFNDFLLKAPTGSGKTIVTGGYIDMLFENYDNVVILWVSETPNLTKQSLDKLSYMFGLPTSFYGEDVNTKFDNKTVIGINWEKIKNTKAREDTEQTSSIDKLVRDAKSEGMKVITVIDEAHSHADSKLSKEFLEVVDSDIVLNVTATPKREYDFIFEVDVKDVQDAGFIKHGIIVNDLDSDYNEAYRQMHNIDGVTEYFLHQSLTKRDTIEESVKRYAKENELEPFVPLLVIQLPNKRDDIMERVEKYFNTLGINRDNGNLAVYMHDDYTDELDAIGKDENVKVLLFKQAISKGWDCPRASLITLLREPKEQTFATQTIGRILRMPYLGSYSSMYDHLNYGYVFIEETDNKILQRVEDNIQSDEGVPLTLFRKNGIETDIDTLKKQVWINTTVKGTSAQRRKQFINLFEASLKDNYFEYLFDQSSAITHRGVQSGKVGVTDLITGGKVEFSDESFTNRDLELSALDEENNYRRLCRFEDINRDDVWAAIEEHIIPNTDNSDAMIIRNILNRNELFISHTKALYDKIDEANKEEFSKKLLEWSIPSQWVVPVNAERMPNKFSDKIPYKEMFLEKNRLEEGFAEKLVDDDNVILWYKNGDSGSNYFSIAYEHGTKHRHFYPDFLIETENSLYVLETKGQLDSDENIQKVESMKKYDTQYIKERDKDEQPKPVVLGYVKQDNGIYYLYTGDNFSKHKDSLDGWDVVDFS